MLRTAASTPIGAESRAFVQRRVGNLGLVMAAIGGAFIVMRVAAVLSVGPLTKLAGLSMLVHYAGVAVSLVVWLACRSGERSLTSAYAIELVGVTATCGLYALMAQRIPQAFRPETTILLGFSVFLLAHAVHVPSSWRWTTLLGSAIAVPLLLGAWTILSPMDPRIVAASAASPDSVQRSAVSIIGIGMASVVTWWLVIVATAATASAVIYGLRREVREARQLGQYTLEEKLGEGGMGVVYRANHAMLRRPTAVKLLLPERVGEESLARFEREVRSTARLSHPNTVTIYDYGRTSDGLFYYAMELLDGASLAEVVDLTGPMPPGRVVHKLLQVSGALAEAHDLGLIHRDIKPANVMLTSQGGLADVAKVVDFGLVKPIDAASDPEVTTENEIVGTPLCLAPEVIRGESDDRASRDLYALGCVAYYLLTGDHPFVADTAVAVCALHLSVPPVPPSERLGEPIPSDLEELVLELLAKRVDERPESAAALLQRLEGCASRGSWTQRDARTWWKRWAEELHRRRELRTGDVSEPSAPLSVDVHARGRAATPTTRPVKRSSRATS